MIPLRPIDLMSQGGIRPMVALGIALWILASPPRESHAGPLTTLASFDGLNGLGASSNVIMDTNGNVYGTAERGGTDGFGTVWETDELLETGN